MKCDILKPYESVKLYRNIDMKMPTTTTTTSQARSFHGPGPVVLEHKNMKFLITDRPTNTNLPQYITVRTPLTILKVIMFLLQDSTMFRFVVLGAEEILRSNSGSSLRANLQHGIAPKRRNYSYGKHKESLIQLNIVSFAVYSLQS